MSEFNGIKAGGKTYDIWATKSQVQELNNVGNAGLANEMQIGKTAIANAIIAKGGEAQADESLSELATDITNIPNTGISPDGIEWSNELETIPNKAGDIFGNKEYIVRATCNIPTLHKYVFRGLTRLVELNLPITTSFVNGSNGDQIIYQNDTLKILRIPNLTKLYTYNINSTNLEYLYLDSVTEILGLNIMPKLQLYYMLSISVSITASYTPLGSMPDLIDIVAGANINSNFRFYGWSPTNAMLNTSSSLIKEGETFSSNREKLLYNIREHIAANLTNRIDEQTHYTITFESALYNVLDSETLEAFTDKGWNVASA